MWVGPLLCSCHTAEAENWFQKMLLHDLNPQQFYYSGNLCNSTHMTWWRNSTWLHPKTPESGETLEETLNPPLVWWNWMTSIDGQWKCLCYHRCQRCTLDTLQRWLICTCPTQPSAASREADQTRLRAKLLKSKHWSQRTSENDSTIGWLFKLLVYFVSPYWEIFIFDF